jgi:hypothetical protein
MMNYGDGLYGGQFVGAMYAEAFFENDPVKIVEAGLKAIPEGSQYAEMVRDVIKWHGENPDDWEATWELINKKYHENPDYRRLAYFLGETPLQGTDESYNIDVKINGAYIAMGLLYGEGDPDKTIVKSMRCGQDSDCNPSNAAGVLFTTLGYENVPERFISGLDNKTKFIFTEYTFPGLIDVTEKLAREAIILAGGRIEKGLDDEDVFVIPVSEPVPSALEQSWEPGPVSDNQFSDEELAQLEGHWIFNYSLLILLILAILLVKENRNLKSILIFIPLIIIYSITRLLEDGMNADMLGTINFLLVVETLAVGMALLLLLGRKIASLKWLFSVIIAIIVLAIVGFAGVSGADDGRIITATIITLLLFILLSGGWLFGMIFSAFLCRKNYGKMKFNIYALLGFFVFEVIGGLYVVALFLGGTIFGLLAGNIGIYLINALLFAILFYLITLPFLILTYRSAEYEQRFLNWIGQGSADG